MSKWDSIVSEIWLTFLTTKLKPLLKQIEKFKWLNGLIKHPMPLQQGCLKVANVRRSCQLVNNVTVTFRIPSIKNNCPFPAIVTLSLPVRDIADSIRTVLRSLCPIYPFNVKHHFDPTGRYFTFYF